MPADPAEELLLADALASGYGTSLVVRGVSIGIGRGEVVGVVGPNGSGKSTLLKAMAGLIPARSGRIWHDGQDVTGLPAHLRARRGIAYLPQDREVFASLTVRENLLMGGYALDRRALRAALERVHAAYPALGRLDRATAGRLSGGERKTVAMARLMMSSPSVVLLDEPTASLAPIPASALLERDVPALAASGAAVILVEQRVAQALAVCDRACVLVGGEVAIEGAAADLARRDLGAVFLSGGRAAAQAQTAEAAAQGEAGGGLSAGGRREASP